MIAQYDTAVFDGSVCELTGHNEMHPAVSVFLMRKHEHCADLLQPLAPPT
jgi:hypothetical protein